MQKQGGWSKCLTVAVGVLLIGATVIGIDLVRDVVVLGHLFNTALTPRELPVRYIRGAFKTIAGSNLPRRTDGLRCIFHGGRDPGIFVTFGTDSDGAAYVLRTFGGPEVRSERVDPNAGERLSCFGIPAYWQGRIRSSLVDWHSLGPSRVLVSEPGVARRGYSVLIEEGSNRVCIFAYLR